MKFLRILGKSLGIFLLVVAGLAIATLATVDESPLRKSPFYKFTRQRLTGLPLRALCVPIVNSYLHGLNQPAVIQSICTFLITSLNEPSQRR